MAVTRGQTWAALVTATLLGLPAGTIYAYSVLLKPLETLLDAPRWELTAVFALSAVGFSVGMNLAPVLYRRISPPLILVLATVFNTAGMALSSMASSTLDLAIGYGAMFGISSGCSFTVYQQAVNLTVTRNRGLANGYVVSLYPLGAMIGAPLLGWAVEHWGVRAAFVGLAGAFAVPGVIAIALFMWAKVPLTETVSVTAGAAPVVSRSQSLRWTFWKIFGVFFLAAAAGLMVLSQAAAIIAAYGGAGPLAVYGTTGITAAIAAARIGGGWLTDKLAVPVVMACAQAVALLGVAVLTILPSPAVAVLTLAMIGVGYGLISGSTAGAIALYWPRVEFGRIAGRMYIAWCVAAITLPILAARLFELTGGYRIAFLIAGAGNLCGILIASTLPRRSGATEVRAAPAVEKAA